MAKSRHKIRLVQKSKTKAKHSSFIAEPLTQTYPYPQRCKLRVKLPRCARTVAILTETDATKRARIRANPFNKLALRADPIRRHSQAVHQLAARGADYLRMSAKNS